MLIYDLCAGTLLPAVGCAFRVHAFTQFGCCAERYEQWILSDPLAFLWQVIAVTPASEPLFAWGNICVFYTVQCQKALPSHAGPFCIKLGCRHKSFPVHDMLQFSK